MDYKPGCLGKFLHQKEEECAKEKSSEESGLQALFSKSCSAVFQATPAESNLVKIKEGKKREKIPTGKKKFKKWQEERLRKQKESNRPESKVQSNSENDDENEQNSAKKKKKKKKKENQVHEETPEEYPQSTKKRKLKEEVNEELAKKLEEGDDGEKLAKKREKKKKKKAKKKDPKDMQAKDEPAVIPKPTSSKKRRKQESEELSKEEEDPETQGRIEASQDTSVTDTPSKDAQTIFVGNIPTEVKLKKLRSTFKEFGEIESIRMRSVAVKGTPIDDAGNQKLMKKVCIHQGQFGEEKDSYNAYIVFKLADSVQKALTMNSQVMEGHHLRVDRVDKDSRDPSRTVFLGNLNFSITEEEVRSHITAHFEGDESVVESVRLIRDHESQLGKGFGYVLLKDRASVAEALKLDGSKLKGRKIRVQVCGRRLKSQNQNTIRQPAFQGRKTADGALRRIRGKFKRQGLAPVQSLLSKKKKGKKHDAGMKTKNEKNVGKPANTKSKQNSQMTKAYTGKKKRTPEQIARRMQKKQNKRQKLMESFKSKN